MSKLKILVATHQKDILFNDDIYMPIQVGKSLSNTDFGIQGDNTGDNISTKNPYYCELTSLYWAWKNLQDFDYIGLCHYRRYFDFSFVPFLMKEEENVTIDYLMNHKEMITPPKSIENYDVILPTSRPFTTNIITCHIINLNVIDISVLEKIILKLYPDYRSSLEYVFYHKQDVPQRNMFIMKKEFFDKYCDFLFSILFQVEKYIKLSPYKHFQRVFGYMGEILLPLFCYHNNLKINRRRILFVTDTMENSSKLSTIKQNIINKVQFKVNNLSKKTNLISDVSEDLLRKEIPELFIE